MIGDQLEMDLRKNNITSIKDVEGATGQIGYTLKKEAQRVTKKKVQQLQQSY